MMHPNTPKLSCGHQTKNHHVHILAQPILLPGKPSEPINDTTKAWEQDPPEGTEKEPPAAPASQPPSTRLFFRQLLSCLFGFFVGFGFFFPPQRAGKGTGSCKSRSHSGGQKSKEI